MARAARTRSPSVCLKWTRKGRRRCRPSSSRRPERAPTSWAAVPDRRIPDRRRPVSGARAQRGGIAALRAGGPGAAEGTRRPGLEPVRFPHAGAPAGPPRPGERPAPGADPPAMEQFELLPAGLRQRHRGGAGDAKALLRWHHPVLGSVSPAVTIELAERSGLIVPLGAWILERACSQAAQWPANWRVREPVGQADGRGRPDRSGVGRAGRRPPGAAQAGAGDHGVHLHPALRAACEDTERAAGHGHRRGAGRFRLRLFQPEPPAFASHRLGQDRPQFHLRWSPMPAAARSCPRCSGCARPSICPWWPKASKPRASARDPQVVGMPGDAGIPPGASAPASEIRLWLRRCHNRGCLQTRPVDSYARQP